MVKLARNNETLVTRTARELGALSLTVERGAHLGAEDDLLARFGVSRPTLRQAAKLAENDRLISVRRGIRGGFYAERPDASDAIRMLARFLRLQGATMAQVLSVNRLVAEEAAILAARCQDLELRRALAAFVATIDGNDTPAAMIRGETELARILAKMSGNPAIGVVMEIGYTFGMEERSKRFYTGSDDRARAQKLQHDLCRSILLRDADVARIMMQRRSAMILEWLNIEI
jgi:GntR family transcriptional regulator, transcriptional repressor for pyruvate dehydrogenase complex